MENKDIVLIGVGDSGKIDHIYIPDDGLILANVDKPKTTEEHVAKFHENMARHMPESAIVFKVFGIQIRMEDDKHFVKKYISGPRNARMRKPRRERRIIRRYRSVMETPGKRLSKALLNTFNWLAAEVAQSLR